MNKIKILCLVFSTLLRVNETYKVDVVCKLFALLCFIFLGAAPIHYAQMAILNLPHP